MVDVQILKKIPTRYDANKKFANRFKIYYYFSARYKEDNTHEYYLFDGNISFERNFEMMQEKFKYMDGYWSLYTDNKKYPICFSIDKYSQLKMTY